MKASKLLTLAVVMAARLAAQNPTGGIRGTVLDSVSHQPVAEAGVSLRSLGPGSPGSSNSGKGRHLTTDASGTFAFSDLAPGQYLVAAQHPDYPLSFPDPIRKAALVRSGEETGDVNVELTPSASVSGHILDEDGDPISNCSVQLQVTSARHPELDFSRYLPPGPGASADAHGEYRSFGVIPGHYLLIARCRSAVFQPRPLSYGPDPPASMAWESRSPPEAVELLAGTEKRVDLTMRPVPAAAIHITLLPAADWKGKPFVGWQLFPAASSPGRLGRSDVIQAADGKFDIPLIAKGSWTLIISASQELMNIRGRVLYQTIEVGDKPLEVAVFPQPAPMLNGTVEIEGASTNTDLSRIRVLTVATAGPRLMSQVGVAKDGKFTLVIPFPGVVKLEVTAPHAFLKSAWLGSHEAIDGKVDLSAGAPGELKLILSTKTATVRGIAPAGSSVTIAPEDTPLFASPRHVEADGNGQFTIADLAPGNYHIVAGDQVQPQIGEEGSEISVAEGQTVVVELSGK